MASRAIDAIAAYHIWASPGIVKGARRRPLSNTMDAVSITPKQTCITLSAPSNRLTVSLPGGEGSSVAYAISKTVAAVAQ